MILYESLFSASLKLDWEDQLCLFAQRLSTADKNRFLNSSILAATSAII